MLSLRSGARAFIPVALAGAILISLAPSTPAAAAEPTTEAQQIIKIAEAKLGDPWRFGAIGPNAFDCSGLVIHAFRAAGEGRLIRNGKLRSARAMYLYFRSRGLASRSNPKLGDLVVWGGGTHIGIYVGHGKAISTLTRGVRVHGVFAVHAAFTAYLHTGVSGSVAVRTAAATTTAARQTKTSTTTAVASTRTRQTYGVVNLRRGPGVQYARIRTLASGTRLVVSGKRVDARGRTWYHVTAHGGVGWIAGWMTR